MIEKNRFDLGEVELVSIRKKQRFNETIKKTPAYIVAYCREVVNVAKPKTYVSPEPGFYQN